MQRPIEHIDLRDADPIAQDTERGVHVIAAFASAKTAEAAARKLGDAALDGTVRVGIREADDVIPESESFEELRWINLEQIRLAALGGAGGAVVGAALGAIVAAVLVWTGVWSGTRPFIIATLAGAGALAWAGVVLLGFRAQWEMSYRDVAARAPALVLFDTGDRDAATRAFAELRHAAATRVGRYEGELKSKYVSPSAPLDD